ncbi:V-set domain-containing T-cell activation inhibitor 1 [Polymixia lowei]
MASLGQTIFWSMIVLIVIFAGIIILTLTLALTGTAPDVDSRNRLPVANLGEDVLLNCYVPLFCEGRDQRNIDMAITWKKEGLSGVVYQYQDGVTEFRNQHPDFQTRTHLFLDLIASGNASLLLRSVRTSDEGVYRCTVGTSIGGGSVEVHLRTAAYSAAKFTLTKDNVLIAEAQRWFPKPNVAWLDRDGNILNSSTTFSQNSVGIFSLVSTLKAVRVRNTYTCSIRNRRVNGMSEATITDIRGRTPDHAWEAMQGFHWSVNEVSYVPPSS